MGSDHRGPGSNATPPETAGRPEPQREATEWLAKRADAERWSDEDERAFQAWLDASDAHRRAFEEASATLALMSHREAFPAGEVDRVLAASERGQPVGPVGRWRRGLAVAAAAALLVTCAGVIYWWWAGADSNWQREFRTATAQRRQVQLADGSTVHLDAGTRIRCRLQDGLRRVRLLRGRALFEVRSAEPRPFVVRTPTGHSIRVTGTVFSVHTVGPLSGAPGEDHRTRVAVREGSVRLLGSEKDHSGRAAVRLDAGQRAVWRAGQPEPTVRSFPTDHFAAWRDGRFRYRGASLASVVDDLRRYGSTGIELSDPKLVELKLTGTFRSRDLSAILRAVEWTLPVRIRQPAPDRVRIEPAPSGPRPSPW